METNPSKVGIYRKEPFSYLLPYYNGELNNRPFRVTYPAEKYFIPLIREYDITHRLNMILQVSRIEYFLYALYTNYMEALSDIIPKDIRELLKLNLFTIESNPEKSFSPDILKNYRGSLNSLREFMGMETLTGEIEKLESQAKLDTPVYQMCIKNK